MLRLLLVASGVAAALGSGETETAGALRGVHHSTHHHKRQISEHGVGSVSRFKAHRGLGTRAHAAARSVEGASRLRHKHNHHHHRLAGTEGKALNAFYKAHTRDSPAVSVSALLEIASAAGHGGNPMLGDNNMGGAPQAGGGDDQSALAQLTKAAGTIEMRFKTSEKDKQFGEGLDKKLVGQVARDSETFWDDVKLLTPADTQGMTDEDAQDLQKVVQQVAQMDDDLDDPKRTGKVAGEYDEIRAELADVDV